SASACGGADPTAVDSSSGTGLSLEYGCSLFLRIVYTASDLKKSRGISSSFGLLGVGMTMPKSAALPSNLGCTVKDSTFSFGSQVMKAFWAGCKMSASLAEK